MNILFITSESAYFQNAFGGAETSIRLLATQLAKNGHGVFYVTKDYGGSFLPRLERHVVDGVKLLVFRMMRGYKHLRLIVKLNEKLLERHLTQLIRKQNIQIAYCHYQSDNLRLLIRIREKLGTFKVVMRMPGMKWYEECLRDSRRIDEYQNLFNQIDAINYNHEDLERMVSEKIAELNLDVKLRYAFCGDIGSPLSPGRTEPYGNHQGDVFTIVMASRFSYYQKRQDILVRAVSMLDPDTPVSVKLVGNGPMRPEIEAMIEKWNLSARVEIISFLPQNELWELLLSCDLMCHACEYEGLSKIILESMSVGLPVLASDVSPVNRYIEDGVNGFLVENDPAAWAEKIGKLIQNKEARRKASVNAIKFIKENHDPAENVKLYENHFGQVFRH